MPYTDNSGIEHESYEAACHYYGADTPAQIAADEAAEANEFLDYCAGFDCFPAEWFPVDVELDIDGPF